MGFDRDRAERALARVGDPDHDGLDEFLCRCGGFESRGHLAAAEPFRADALTFVRRPAPAVRA